MSLLNMILGNVSEVDAESLERDFGPLLCEGERIERAYKLVRDKWVFTNKRLILQNVQGVTGKKVEYHTIPYRSIVHYSIENAGTFDMDAELKLWVRGFDGPIVQNFSKNSNLRELQQVLANYVL
ncbi:PH domain-containing protein [Porphyromonas levii]|uniref:PH domain-containing protein n=1 Tax=Porphyromonas levii TaxID=28114 RepID=A0A4Y8WPC2_9PORP|nr:PH domain-containing protein [Porphyromonas levii]MBR8713846.1 hypothetical protein [Porphyromonas levii]MBR8715826.1 hypothetical protein [Porphyromonas levii]MBR8728393.1 hypothetical protein [Porphyromonas levii]MBR8732298.1 hypothetical protein [Porphyromonas levii]MBR8736699.1 hypothetical protein [Porphyromonas levii]